jgi:rhodanese-related sulfurtransferase
MNKTKKCGFWSLSLSLLMILTATACGSVDNAAETGSEVETPAAEPTTTPAESLPALRTNDAGAVLVTQEEVLRMIDAGTAPVILDVRTAEEFAEGHVPGAINISHDELADRLAEIDATRDTGLIVYCRSGRRAGIAEELLLSEGFRDVQHLEGDMIAWLEANQPTEKQ